MWLEKHIPKSLQEWLYCVKSENTGFGVMAAIWANLIYFWFPTNPQKEQIDQLRNVDTNKARAIVDWLLHLIHFVAMVNPILLKQFNTPYCIW
jgi:hypothetical protein